MLKVVDDTVVVLVVLLVLVLPLPLLRTVVEDVDDDGRQYGTAPIPAFTPLMEIKV